MTELRILDLSSNQLAGAWPPLGDMLNLRSLDLSSNLLGEVGGWVVCLPWGDWTMLTRVQQPLRVVAAAQT